MRGFPRNLPMLSFGEISQASPKQSVTPCPLGYAEHSQSQNEQPPRSSSSSVSTQLNPSSNRPARQPSSSKPKDGSSLSPAVNAIQLNRRRSTRGGMPSISGCIRSLRDTFLRTLTTVP